MFSYAGRQSFHVVAAFEQRQNPSAAVIGRGLDNPTGDLAIGLLSDAHPAQWIAAVGVESRRKEDGLRLIYVDGTHDDVFDATQIGSIAEALLEGDVQRAAAAGALADLGHRSCAGVKRETVHRGVEDVVTVP